MLASKTLARMESGRGGQVSTVRLEAFADHHIPSILSGCADWQELSQYGPPYWRPRSTAELRRKISASSGPQVASEYNFVIMHDTGTSNGATESRAVGECSVHGIDWRNRIGQIGICIWHPEDRHQGSGQEATTQIIDWAFGYLGLQTLEVWIVEGNQPSLHMFAKLGFEQEGVLRGRYRQAGELKSMAVFARSAL